MNNIDNLSKQQKKELIIKKAAREGLPEFAVAIDPKYKVEWFHKEIALKLEEAYHKVQRGEDVRLMIFIPPRHGKSDLATQKFPAWVLGQSPDMPIVVASYSQELATDFGQGTRDIMRSHAYRMIFDTQLRPDTEAKAKWMTEEDGGYTAVGVGGTLTGKGFKIGIIDDPFKNREEADSDTVRDSRHKWYKSTFSTREEGNSAIILILTRWHDDDLAGRLLEEQKEAEQSGEEDYDRWEILEYKAIAEKDEKHRRKGEALWASKFPIGKLNKKKKTLGSYEWSALYQQNPIDEENQEFRQDWFKYRSLEEVLGMQTRRFATIDTALKSTESADFTGVTRNYVDLANSWNLISQRYKINSKQIIDLIFKLYDESFEVIGIEEGAFTHVIEPFLKDAMHERQKYPHIIPLKHHQTQKETRIRGLIPRYETGKVFHVTDKCQDLEEELLRFPKSINDDCADATAYQIQVAEAPELVEEGEDFSLYGQEYT